MRAVLLFLLAMLLIPAVNAASSCNVKSITISSDPNPDPDFLKATNKGDNFFVTIEYEHSNDCLATTSNVVLNLTSYNGQCKFKPGGEMEQIQYSTTLGSSTGEVVQTLQMPEIHSDCQMRLVKIQDASIFLDGQEVKPNEKISAIVVGTNEPLKTDDISIELLTNCASGECKPTDTFSYAITYPKYTHPTNNSFDTPQNLFQVISGLLNNGTTECQYYDEKIEGSPPDLFVISDPNGNVNNIYDSCTLNSGQYTCTTTPKNFAKVVTECSEQRMYLQLVNLYAGNQTCYLGEPCREYTSVPSAAKIGIDTSDLSGQFDFPLAGCVLQSLDIDTSQCTSGYGNERCDPTDKISATALISGSESSCKNIEELILYDEDKLVLNLSEKTIISIETNEFKTDGLVDVSTLPTTNDGLYSITRRAKGYASGILQQDLKAERIIKLYTGECRQASLGSEFFSDTEAFIIPGWANGGTYSSERRAFGVTNQNMFQVADATNSDATTIPPDMGIGPKQPCATIDEEGYVVNHTCQPGQQILVAFGLQGDCSHIERAEIEFVHMKANHPPQIASYPVTEDWSNGTSAAHCFPNGKLTTYRDRILFDQQLANSESDLDNLDPFPDEPLGWLGISSEGLYNQKINSISPECLNLFVMPENLTLYNSSGEVLTYHFKHNNISSTLPSQYDFSMPNYFQLGDLPGNHTERYCPEVWDDSGIKLLNSSCNMFVDSSGDYQPINTQIAEDITGKCPTEDYCLWHRQPFSEGQETPSTNNISFWSRVECIAPGQTVMSGHLGAGVELECMGRQPNGNELEQLPIPPYTWEPIGDPVYANPFCPTYGIDKAGWDFDQYGGWCFTNDFLCSDGIYPSEAPKHVGGDELDTILCDGALSDLLLDTSVNGTAERCFRSTSSLEKTGNNATQYPKYGVCCPFVSIPVPTDQGDVVDYHFFDMDSLKIY